MTTPLATPAWILAGRLRNVPGLLVADPDGFVVEFAQEIPRSRGRAT